MRIAIIARGIPSEKAPMNGIFEWDQARALAEAGLQVNYLAVDLRSIRKLRPWGITHGQKDGIAWHRISIPIGPLPLMLFCKIGAWGLRYLYQNVFRHGIKPDIIHAHFLEYGYMAAKLAEGKKIPLIITEHSSRMIQSDISKGLRRIAKESYQSADCVIAVSDALRESIYRHTGIVAEIVPNVVSTEFCYEMRKHAGIRFVSVGNLNSGKRMNILLRAFAGLCVKHNDVLLEIVGDGELRKELEGLAKELHLDRKVKFHGKLPRQEIMEIFKSSDCFVLPSAFETFGVVYIEAMAAGLPVIATRCGGPEDFVTEENGLLVSVDDTEALMEAMDRMYRNGTEFDGAKISMSIRNRVSGNVVAAKLKKVYEEVIDAGLLMEA